MVQSADNANKVFLRNETRHAPKYLTIRFCAARREHTPRTSNQYLTCSPSPRPCTHLAAAGCALTRRFSGIVRRDGTRLARLGAAMFATADGLQLAAVGPIGAVLSLEVSAEYGRSEEAAALEYACSLR